MRCSKLLPVVGVVLVAASCAHGPAPAPAPLPEPEIAILDPRTEAEVRAFLAAEADEIEAALQADLVVDDEIEAEDSDALFDPADFDLPIHYDERVQFWIDYFLADRNRDRFANYLVRMGRYEEMIRSKLRERGMPEDLIYLALIESGFTPSATSRAKAVGIWQFMAGTARGYRLEISHYVDERRDPVKSTDAALDYLADLYEKFGSWYLAAAGYNGGGNRVERLLRRHAGGERGADSLFWTISEYLPSETRNYVPKMIAAAIIAKRRDRFGFGDVVPAEPEAYDVVTVPDATGLDVIAEAAGVDVKVIEQLNPQFLRGATPPGRKAEVRIPAGHAPRFADAYAKIPPSRRVRVVEHRVQKGETLSHIARRYGTSVAALMAANRISDPRSLRAGRILVVRVGDEASQQSRTTPARKSVPAPRTTATTDDVHHVQQGETLWGIARKYGMSVDELREMNGLAEDATIHPEQRLVVRTAVRVTIYRVQPGDTLWDIARRYGVSTEQLMEWNALTPNSVIRPGDEVRIHHAG